MRSNALPQCEETAVSNADERALGPCDELEASVPRVGPVRHPALPADGRSCQWHLPSVESAIPQIRRGLRVFLDTTELSDDESQDLVLAACEAATNAVEHAQHPELPFFDVSAEIGLGIVTVEVRDHGRWLEPTPSPYRGRGLAMMRALSDTTVSVGAHGTTVTIRKYGSSIQAPAEEGWAS
jgi:anti-sigma regulatory factor (Ser/Thr protein kinase)